MATELPTPGVTPRIVWAEMVNEGILSREADAAAADADLQAQIDAIEASDVESVNGHTGVVVLDKADVGLADVDDTSDVDKPISTAQQAAIDAKAPLASPTFSGTLTIGDRLVYTPTDTGHLASGALTLDSAAATLHRLVVYADITSMTISNAVDAAELKLMIAQSAAWSVVWPTNMRFNGGLAPGLPVPAYWLSMTFLYETLITGGIWVEQSRTTVPMA